MNILYDSQIFEMQKYGGISRYFVELMSEYSEDSKVDFYSSSKLSDNEYLLNYRIRKNWVIPFKYKIKGNYTIKYLVNRLFTRYKLMTSSIDIFHPTYYDPYFLDYIGNIPFILTVYDMTHEKFPDMFHLSDPTSKNKKLLADRASRIIAISESTKQDIIDILGIEASKIDVVYLGNSMQPFTSPALVEGVSFKYILFVGSRTDYKNFNRFVKAVSLLLQDDTDLHVICAGGGVFQEDEKKIFFELNVNEKIHQYNVDDKTLSQLYKQALLFVFPSMYEGFGIPVLEAFACSCPLACSNTSSLPEVAGDAAAYFDPMDEESILEAIIEVINNSKLRKKMVQDGQERLKMFSWKKTAQETKKVYESIL